MKLNYKYFFILAVFTNFLFSCSNDDEAISPIIEVEEVVLLEFNNNFNPINNTNNQVLLPIPTLTWSIKNKSETDDILYDIKLGTSLSNLNLLNSTKEESHQIETLLNPESEYFWEVSFTNRDGKKTISDIIKFTTSKIEFADPMMEQVIRDALTQPEGDFTRDELEKIINIPADITVLDYEAHTPYGGIEVLTGLEYCTNLKRVNLFQNGFRSPISDLKPLENLTSITYLNVANNKVYDLTPLSKLSNLEYLHLGWNIGVSDISPIAHLNKLKTLNLTYTHGLRDITPIENLTQLDSLDYSHAYYIEDISSIGKLINLKHLRFTGSEIIDDFEFLNNLKKIESLHLDRNIYINNLSFVPNMPLLKKLNLSSTGITDISLLANFNSMEFLSLRGLKISDFSILKNMPNLKELHFDDSVIDNSILSTTEIRNMFPEIKMIINGTVYNG
ncbi:leucine-rich repeat domain-containing protein [Cellulophaga baltica]|uniref:leucine-rich repeat domain-containing protein n=1 Tax=Cellulophaga baltica TaxID=76594 RepID=UPI0037CA4172